MQYHPWAEHIKDGSLMHDKETEDTGYAMAMNDLMAKKFKDNGGCFGQAKTITILIVAFSFFIFIF